MGNSGSTWGTVIILRFVSSLLEALACVSRRDCSILSGNQSHHLRKGSCHMGGSGLKSSSIALKLIPGQPESSCFALPAVPWGRKGESLARVKAAFMALHSCVTCVCVACHTGLSVCVYMHVFSCAALHNHGAPSASPRITPQPSMGLGTYSFVA